MAPFRIRRHNRRVKNRGLDRGLVLWQLKNLAVDMFRPDILEPDKIADDEPLAGCRFCLDSLDTLELSLCIEEVFGIAMWDSEALQRPFTTLADLASLIFRSAQTPVEQRRLLTEKITEVIMPLTHLDVSRPRFLSAQI